MKKFEILPHIADLRIKSFGKTKKELFLNSLLGMMESLRPEIEKSSKNLKRKIKIKSPDLAGLLVDFLSEVLYLTQVKREIYRDVKFKEISQTELEAELSGQKVKRFNEDIKAVTYHGLDVHQKEDKIWEVTILFDI